MRELDESFHPVQIEIFRNMPHQKRLQLAGELTRATWNRALEALRRANPEDSEARILKKFVGSLYGQDLAERVYPDL